MSLAPGRRPDAVGVNCSPPLFASDAVMMGRQVAATAKIMK